MTPVLPVGKTVIIQDRAEADRYAKAFAMFDNEILKRAFSEPAVCVISQKHQTHWLMACMFRGFADSRENGASFIALPKHVMSIEQLHDFVRSFMGNARIELRRDIPPRAKGSDIGPRHSQSP